MLWFEVAQAVTITMFGPLSPYSIEMMPLAMLEIIIGIVKGETRFGPRVMYVVCSFSSVARPPMPLPTITPNRRGSMVETSRPESVIAILEAATANCT